MKRNLFVTAMMLVIAAVAGYNWFTDSADLTTARDDAEQSTVEETTADSFDQGGELDDPGANDATSGDSSIEPQISEDQQDQPETANSVGKVSDLSDISFDELPPEALDTIDLIYRSGPYPFSKDDSVFQNREGILPDQDIGYYREYTVITPGLDHRGARRIVGGATGELYYTSDHYDSFSEIDQSS